MAALSALMQEAIINYFRGISMPAAPVSLEIALYTSDPGDDNSGTEVSAGGYSRQAITLTAPSTTIGVGSLTTNSGDITFGPATADWGSVTHWAIFGVGGGSFYLHGSFLGVRTVLSGEGYTIYNGTLNITGK